MGLMASVDPELLVFVMLYCSGKEVRSPVIAALFLSLDFGLVLIVQEIH